MKIIFSLYLLVSITFISYSQPTDGLVAYYPFNGNANDESTNNNNGNVFGANLTTDIFGNPNSAYFFDGIDDYIIVPDQNSLDLTDALSISVWIEPITTEGKYIVVKGNNITGGNVYDLDIYPNKARAILGPGVGSITSDMLIKANEWQHLVFTWDGQNMILYYNGSLDKQKTSNAFQIPIMDTPLEIGSYSGAVPILYFHGKIDDLIIYNRALTAEEVLALYEAIIPVELTSFTANVNTNRDVILNWSTATETNNLMFEIQRKKQLGEYLTIGYVNGHGTIAELQEYSFTDRIVEQGKYYYRLKQIDFDGSFEYSDEIEVDVTGPLTLSLRQNYPNPFNPSTIILYRIPVKSKIVLIVYDVLGNEVAILINEEKSAGNYEVEFDATGLPSGIYFYLLQAGDFIETKKMVLMR